MLSSFLSVSVTSSPELAEEVTAIIEHSINNVLSIVFRSTNEISLVWFWFFVSLQETFNSYPQTKSSEMTQPFFLHVIDRYRSSSLPCSTGNFIYKPSAHWSSLLSFLWPITQNKKKMEQFR